MLFAGLRLEVRRFFGTIMLILGDRGYSRADRKQMIRNSGLIEKCRVRHLKLKSLLRQWLFCCMKKA